MPRRPLLAALAALTLLSSCVKDEPPQLSEEEKRTLDKLRAEVDREREANDPNARLAKLATTSPGAAEGPRPLPAKSAPIATGPLELTLTGVHAGHHVSGGKLSVASEDWFLRVTLQVRNKSRATVPANFSLVRLKGGEDDHPLARDAQRLAGTRDLDLELAPGGTEEVILYFEVPTDALGTGKPEQALTLHLPAGVAGGAEASLPIE